MEFINNLNDALEKWSLLKHPFYQAWNNGILNKDTLNVYAQEYYHHVAAFPRYISQIHALCADIRARQVLLENLVDEEQGDNNHPELWLRFIEGLGVSRDDDKNPKFESTKRLVNGFFELTQTDYSTGLGALYAYERQTPTVSKVKIDGLKKHYNIHNQRTLEFFVVHAKTDIWHTNELIKLINKLNSIEQKQVHYGAVKGAKLLWQFLDGMEGLYANLCH
ncbi:CADD family putative folate metabolism protein [Candidatus Tisiphia endosymbiont of Ditula angustiorana]|uniref:CADD family putative folate metabolism protein n=1 Tax=Candidatus Tisiphia endosymbiont of Ditula angustiorana TaxID=3066272 RepID=UPI00312CC1CB